jgi:hypothetical protein
MKKWLLFSVGLMLLFGCKNLSNNKNSLSNESTHNNIEKQILGFWIAKGEPSGFQIRKDSIYYAEEFKSYKYILTKNDTLVIYFDGYVNKSKIVMNNTDTLITIGQDTLYYIRSK